MRAKRCTKCKWFRKTRAKCKWKRNGGFTMVAPSIADSMATFLCKNRWWGYGSHKDFVEGDVCEDFEFKSKKSDEKG